MGQNFTYRSLSMDEKEKIIRQYENLCHKLAHRHQAMRPGLYDHADWFQLAQEALFKAINTYKEEKGVKFITYATKVISRRLMEEVKSAKNKQYLAFTTLSADMYFMDNTEDSQLSGMAFNVDGGKFVCIEEEKINEFLIQDAIRYVNTSRLFDDRERYIFHCRIEPELLGEPKKKTQYQISCDLGCSQEYVCVMEKKIRESLQIYIGSAGFTVRNGRLTSI